MAFTFTEEAEKKLEIIIAKYPEKKAATLPALWLAQQENDGWLSREAMKVVAERLDLTPAYVEGVATFYTMYNKAPIGRHHVEVCHNIVCAVVGAEDVIAHIGKRLGVEKGGTTEDRKFTLNGAECLGACANAPCMMVGSRYFEDLTIEKVDRILDELARS